MEHDPSELMTQLIVAINVGVLDFGKALEEQAATVIYVSWSPPAGGDQDMIELLDQLL